MNFIFRRRVCFKENFRVLCGANRRSAASASQNSHRSEQAVFELFDGRTLPAAHVQMNDGMRLPVIRPVINGKSPEKLFSPLKEGLQGGNRQRLPEAARTGEKIHGVRRFNQSPDVFRFIDIQKAAVPQTFERINAGCQKLFLHGDSPSFLCNLSPERRLVKSMDSF